MANDTKLPVKDALDAIDYVDNELVNTPAGTGLFRQRIQAPETDAILIAGTQKSQVVDGSGNVIGATSNALDINIKSGISTLATVAKQPALGTAGTPSADVLSVQGRSGMTPFNVTSASAPVVTQNAAGNIVAAATSIGASGTSTPVTVDATAKIELQLQFDVLTGGTAQAAGTYTVKIFRVFGAGPTIDTVATYSYQVSMGTAATHYISSIAISTGKYSITVTNGDTANAITFAITSTTIDDFT